ncbi:MAG: FHA domain-containing protein [Nitrospirae bacterium]|nr:FHA domain-containing protein [Nitrospirota bacterium]
MSNERCVNGHYFDTKKYRSCPWCGIDDIADIGPTQVKFPYIDGWPGTKPHKADEDKDDGETRGIFEKNKGLYPVAGWLVCIEGEDRGRDYRIVPEKNYLGREEGMDIRIKSDKSISKDRHCAVSYNPKSNSFTIISGEAKGLTFLNGVEVTTSKELKPFDVIEIGKTKLKFFPCCGENFKWEL